MDRYSVFGGLNPFVHILFFFLAIAVCMTQLHPLVLAACFLGAGTYFFRLKGFGAFKTVFFAISTALCLACFNVLFNHRGETVLLYFKSGNPLTLESILYGTALGISFGCLLLWLNCFNLCFTTDRLMCILKVFPSLSVLLTVTLRFIPLYIKRIKRASADRYAFGYRDKKIKSGIRALEAVSGQVLEEAVEIADVMRGRGLGLKGRTAFSPFAFTALDGGFAVVVMVTALCIFLFAPKCVYLPHYSCLKTTPFGTAVTFAFMMIPTALDLYGDLKWRCLK